MQAKKWHNLFNQKKKKSKRDILNRYKNLRHRRNTAHYTEKENFLLKMMMEKKFSALRKALASNSIMRRALASYSKSGFKLTKYTHNQVGKGSI